MTKAFSEVSHPPFVVRETFIETAFEYRFQGLLRYARLNRSWHVIAAVPGSGKSLGISDMVIHGGAHKDANGTTYHPIIAIRDEAGAGSWHGIVCEFWGGS